ncbi:MAG: DUF6089 family protein [Bacteroidota bacterium]
MRFRKIILLVFLLSFFGQWSLFGQRLRKGRALRPKETEGYVSAGLQLGAANYFGDIPSGIQATRPSAGIFISRKLGPRSHARLGLSWLRLEADDFFSEETSGTYARNLHFRNDIIELSLVNTLDLIPSYGKHQRRALFTPYLYYGVAVIYQNPRARLPLNQGGDWIELQPLGTEGQGRPGYDDPYSKVQLAIPLGLGVKWAINERLNVGIESGIRFAFTDYLDDVSGEYPELDELGNPLAVALANRTLEEASALQNQNRALAAAIERFGIDSYVGFDGNTYQSLASFRRGESLRGNPNSRDLYFVTSVHFSYIINVGLKCPQFK